MAGRMLVKLLFLLMLSELLLFYASEAKPFWWINPWHCDSNNPPGKWVNKWQEEFTFICDKRKPLVEWRSVHRNCKEDRVHQFRCAGRSPLPSKSSCAWIETGVKYDQEVNFECPYNGLMTGVRSEYSKDHRDRKFDFHCCHSNGKSFKAHHCYTTSEQNEWDGDLWYQAPANYYLVGASSVHDNTKEDRRWKFEVCRFGKN